MHKMITGHNDSSKKINRVVWKDKFDDYWSRETNSRCAGKHSVGGMTCSIIM